MRYSLNKVGLIKLLVQKRLVENLIDGINLMKAGQIEVNGENLANIIGLVLADGDVVTVEDRSLTITPENMR